MYLLSRNECKPCCDGISPVRYVARVGGDIFAAWRIMIPAVAPLVLLTGYLLEPRDPAAYADRIGRIIEDPVHAAELGAAAAMAAGRYPWSGLAGRLRRIYLDLVEARSPVQC